MIICPAVTSVSLFASAMSFPASMAAMVGRMPSMPTIAVTKTSAFSSQATAINPSMPNSTGMSRSLMRSASSFAFSSVFTAARTGLNSRICRSSRSILSPADNAVTFISCCARTTSSVWVPMEPVEPKIAIYFISLIPFYLKVVRLQAATDFLSDRK